MIHKNHYIEIFVNGKQLDIESQESLNIRFNNILYDPEKISISQSEYSYEFDLPSTPNNNKIFDHANNLSKLNKFNKKYNAVVYADGTPIFQGTLLLSGYKQNHYQCNLVSVKVYSLDDIFQDSMMTDFDWFVPFNGAASINQYNEEMNGFCFPLVSYGAFQKSPYYTDDVASDYTSKFLFDKWNRWYVESFSPSLNMLETLKRTFEYKGYVVGGDAFEDEILKKIYISTNLADGQSPTYNLGNPLFGAADITVNWQNPMDIQPSGSNTGTTYGNIQNLKFPYFKASFDEYGLGELLETYYPDPEYNLTDIRVYDMLSSDNGGNVSVNGKSYLFQPNEHLIVIPADGFYKIDMTVETNLLTTQNIIASQKVHEALDPTGQILKPDVVEKDISFKPNYRTTCPLEIQLVRNYNEDIELIKGKFNIRYVDGYPDNRTVLNRNKQFNIKNQIGLFPHQKMGSAFNVHNIWTEPNDLSRQTDKASNGYVNNNNQIMAYDPIVNPNFICGFSTMGNEIGGGTVSVIKDGYGWGNTLKDRIDSFYTLSGYSSYDHNGTSYVSTPTNFNKNEYIESPLTSVYQLNNLMRGRVYCMVYLKKNDVLQLFGIHRHYEKTNGASVSYSTSANVHLKITAASPKSMAEIKVEGFGYNTPTEFDRDLRLSNFLNRETKMSEWVEGIIDAFNLEFIQDGKNVLLNTKKKFNRRLNAAVDIDDRVNSDEAETSIINYPKTMAVKYKIDEDEWGFEQSVQPPDKMNLPDWKNYADSGYTVIQLSNDEYATNDETKNLNFSYCWYDDFEWKAVTSAFTDASFGSMGSKKLSIPVISKFTYMIDGYDYEESMKKDGKGLPMRFWFEPKRTDYYVWTRTSPVEKIDLYVPSNSYVDLDKNIDINLSYKTSENSILTQYFNITPYLSANYVTVEVYLTPDEYKMIKNGCMIRYDSDLYYPIELSGYDASGQNPTELKMMKKI